MADAGELIKTLAARGLTIAAAESLTGGLFMATLVSVPGASAVLRGGVVAYATDVKHSLLGVDAKLLSECGPVHPDVAAQMAAGVRVALESDVGISTTGIAGPESPDGQPVGTVHIGISTVSGTTVESFVFPGDRSQIRAATVRSALELAFVSLNELS